MVLNDLEKCLTLRNGEPQPQPGLNHEYDAAFKVVSDIVEGLEKELKKWKLHFGSTEIQYHHGKIRYQIEVPEELVQGVKKPKEFIITSKKKGF